MVLSDQRPPVDQAAIRLDLDAPHVRSLLDLAVRCWNGDRSMRPTYTDLVGLEWLTQ